MVRRQALSSADQEPLPVTEKQLELLRSIRRWSVEHHRMPSVRELAGALGRSASTVQQHLSALERRGCIKRNGSAHGLTLLVDDDSLGLAQGSGLTLVPLRGWVQPGRPLRPALGAGRRVAVAGETRTGDYLLQIEGDKLVSEGMIDGDLLLIRPGPVRNAPALVQYPDGSSDVKRVQRLPSGELSLLPARLRIDRRSERRPSPGVLVKGRVVRLMRLYDD